MKSQKPFFFMEKSHEFILNLAMRIVRLTESVESTPDSVTRWLTRVVM